MTTSAFEPPMTTIVPSEVEEPLALDLYDSLENDASVELPLPVLSAFRPVTYQQNNVPTRVRIERELMRYVDHNFESEVAGLFEPGANFPPACYVNAFTTDEKRLVDQVRDHTAALTGRLFGRPMRPISNLLVQVAPFRILSEIARQAGLERLSVYEAGPGLGYLGALLALAGHRYVSFDVTQGLYLWQNRLMREIAGKDFLEAALCTDVDALERARVVHLPWWHHLASFKTRMEPVDIVYSNSNLCEMSLVAVHMLIDGARRLLKNSPVGLFVFMSWGYPGQSNAEQLHAEFLRQGFRRVQNLPFKAYALADRMTGDLESAFANGIPLINHSGSEIRLDARELVAIRREEAPLDVVSTMEFFGWKPPFLD